MALPLALAAGQWVDPWPMGQAEAAMVVLAVVHALAYVGYVWLARAAGAVFAAQCAYLVTGSGVLWATYLLGERFQPQVWVALALMLAGVALVQPRAAAQRGGR